MLTMLKGSTPLELRRKDKTVELARALYNYLCPLGAIARMEGGLQDVIGYAVCTGLELMYERDFHLPSKNWCRPGDDFDPRLMIAEGILPDSKKEGELMEAGGRVAMVLSPPYLSLGYKEGGNLDWNVEPTDVTELENILVRKAAVLCYTMKEGKDGGISAEIYGI